MSPLVKTLLKKKSRLSCNNKEQLATINRCISELICEKRTHLAVPVGSAGWWKTVDDITQRRTHSNSVVLDNTFANQLNDYFHELGTDLNYIAPVDVVAVSEIEVPEIPERLVWKNLSNIKRTATGPDGIPFWVWKEHAEILTTILSHIWNLSLRTHTWPMSWIRSNINPIPKVDIPREKSDYRGINITPVIARAFEKAVYNTFVKEAVEENLSTTQFAYSESGNCTSALLAIQHFINKHLDNPDCEAVRVFARDFS